MATGVIQLLCFVFYIKYTLEKIVMWYFKTKQGNSISNVFNETKYKILLTYIIIIT